MELPKHTCISCAYLFQSDEGTITATHREWALNDKMWNLGVINYQRLICHMGKKNYPSCIKNNTVKDIRDDVIKSNRCKSWTAFIGISPVEAEQRISTNWTRLGFWVTIIALIIGLVTWILSQFVFGK